MTPEEQLLQAFRDVAAVVHTEDWAAAARLCDPISLRLFQINLLPRFQPEAYPVLSGADLKRQNPDLSDEAAEAQAQDINRRSSERQRRISDEVDGIDTPEGLAVLAPVDLYARWLTANSFERQMRRAIGRHQPDKMSRVSFAGMPRSRLEPLVAYADSSVGYVMYRHVRPPMGAHAAKVLQDHWAKYDAEIRAWALEGQSYSVVLQLFRMQPDGSWKPPAEHHFPQPQIVFEEGLLEQVTSGAS